MSDPREAPNDDVTVMLRSAYLADMVTEMHKLLHDAYYSNYTTRGQNLRPLATAIGRFGQTMTLPDTEDRKAFDELLALLAREAKVQ